VSVFVLTTGSIRQFGHKKIMTGDGSDIFTLDSDLIFTNSQTNHGDSGGPMVNSHGELVAVTQGAFVDANALSIFIDVKEVKMVLEKYADESGVTYELPTGPAVQGDTSGIPDLITALADTNSEVDKRRKAAMRLGECGADAKSAVPYLIRALKDKDQQLRDFAEEALAKIGPPTKGQVPHLVRLLDDSNLEVRLHVLEALRNLGPDAQSAVPAILKATKDSDPKIRERAAQALGRTGAQQRDTVVPALSDAIKDGDKAVRIAAAEALASDIPLTGSDAPLMEDLLKQPDTEVRIQGAHGLKKIGADARDAKAPLLAAFKNADTPLRRAVMEALVEVGPDKDAVPDLEKALRDTDVQVRQHALDAAAKLGPEAKSLVPLVAAAVSERRLCNTALDTLAKIGPGTKDPQVMRVLEQALGDKDHRLQAANTVVAIHPNGPEAAVLVPKLLTILETQQTDKTKELRAKSVEALSKIGKVAVPDLVRKGLRHRNPWVRLGAAKALGEMGRPAQDALNPLAQLEANDPVVEVQQASREAIKKIYQR
jgi:HEAT repeat protein